MQTEREDDTLQETFFFSFFSEGVFWVDNVRIRRSHTAHLHSVTEKCTNSHEAAASILKVLLMCFFLPPTVFVCVGEAKVQYDCKSDERARAQPAVNLRIFDYRSETPKRAEGEQQAIELAAGDPAPSLAN